MAEWLSRIRFSEKYKMSVKVVKCKGCKIYIKGPGMAEHSRSRELSGSSEYRLMRFQIGCRPRESREAGTRWLPTDRKTNAQEAECHEILSRPKAYVGKTCADVMSEAIDSSETAQKLSHRLPKRRLSLEV